MNRLKLIRHRRKLWLKIQTEVRAHALREHARAMARLRSDKSPERW